MFIRARLVPLAAAALLAAAAAVGVAVPAFADLPGAADSWKPVTYSGGAIKSSSTEGEARDSRSNILHAWRGSDNDNIWISLNNGPAYVLPATAGSSDHAQTSAAPTVIWTNDGGRGNFRIFHTGKDGHIYQHRVQLNTSYQLPGTLPNATQLPGDIRTNTNQPPAAAALPGNSYMLAWNSQTSDEIWTMYYDAATTTFYPAQVVPNARSQDAPSLAAQVDDGDDPAPWNQVVLTFEGTDFNIYMARQKYGTSNWTDPRKVGPYTTTSPSVALTDNGFGVIAFRDFDYKVNYYEITRNGDVTGSEADRYFGWTNNAPLVVSSGPLVYGVLTGAGSGYSGVVWRQVADFRGQPTPPAPSW